MSYSYATAKDVLSDTEKNRLLAVYLSTDQPNVDWEAAAQAFGAANVGSMKALIRQTLKKVADAGGKTDVTAPSAVAGTTAQPKKSRGGRKRKAEPVDSDEEVAIKPATKKAAKKATKAKAKVEEDEEDSDDGTLAWKLTRRQIMRGVEPEADVKDEEADAGPDADVDAEMEAGEDADEGAGEDAEEEETVV